MADDLEKLLRWEAAGGTWRVAGRVGAAVTVELCRCDGGEVADRLVCAEPAVLQFIGDRQCSD